MGCNVCAELRAEVEYWRRESIRNKAVARELSLALDAERERRHHENETKPQESRPALEGARPGEGRLRMARG